MSDVLSSLPTDQIAVPAEHERLLAPAPTLVKKRKKQSPQRAQREEQILEEVSLTALFRDPVLCGLVHGLMSLPTVDDALHALVPYTKSSVTARIALKSTIFGAIWFILQNGNSVRSASMSGE